MVNRLIYTKLLLVWKLEQLPHSYEIAKLAGEIARDLKRPIELADAAIAATAVINQASLFTLNEKDFQGIKPLEILKWTVLLLGFLEATDLI